MREASWPLTLQAINKMKLQLKIRESEDWSRCISQGRGAQEFYNDPIGKNWLYRPHSFKSSQYIEAIKLRTNTTGVRTILARCGSLRGSVECRKCLERPETEAHVLGICSHTKAPRIKRHDAIVGAIKDKLQTNDPGNIIYHEQTFTNLDGSNLRPDLVLVAHGMGQVIDIMVRYWEGHEFEETFREKQVKYDGLREDLKQKHPEIREFQVVPIIIGSTGAVPEETRNSLVKIGLSKLEISKISFRVPQSSLNILINFLDYLGCTVAV